MKNAVYRNNILLIGLLLLMSCQQNQAVSPLETDVLLIGGGIMSATLGSMLRGLDQDVSIVLLESREQVALESSNVWNNAGTGHSAFCELNYTPERPDGSIDTSKALGIAEFFELTRQFWAYQVAHGQLPEPKSFIRSVPHMSFVFGAENVAFLNKRFDALNKQLLFKTMEYTENAKTLKNWVPLLMEGRDPKQKVAATRVKRGVDVNFGVVTESLIGSLQKTPNTTVQLNHEVVGFERLANGNWKVYVKDLKSGSKKTYIAKFVFIGAGGAALPLLQKTGLKEGRAFAGFPVGGEFLVTDNQELVKQHLGKVYGRAAVGAPPMSVPHLDTRHIADKKYLLFGPFAVFSTKFLKNGSWFDILASFKYYNMVPMIEAGLYNLDLTAYLVKQVLMSKEKRMDMLRQYFPNAKSEDWRSERAGQRVQIIKNIPGQGGTLKFGTEIVSSKDKSLVALLGASPGASVAVKVALEVLKTSFESQVESKLWRTKLDRMMPSAFKALKDMPGRAPEILKNSSKILGLSD